MKWQPRKNSRDPIEPWRKKNGDLVTYSDGRLYDMRSDDQRREDDEDYRKWQFMKGANNPFITMENYDAKTGVPSHEEHLRFKATGKWDDKNGIIQEDFNLEYWHKKLCEPSF